MSRLLERIANVLKLGEVAGHQDVMPQGSRRWSEQAELWGSRTSSTAIAKSHAADFDFSSTEIVRATRPQTLLSKKTQHGSTMTVSTTIQQTAVRRTEPVSRFFSVNHTVQGDRGSTYQVVRTARLGVSAGYDLWKGPTRQVTFLLG